MTFLRRCRIPMLAALVAGLAGQALAIVTPQGQSPLKAKEFQDQRLRPQPWSQDLDRFTPADLPNHGDWEGFRQDNPKAKPLVDRASGNPSVIEGKIEEWVPGRGNGLTMGALGIGKSGPRDTPELSQLEDLAQSWIERHPRILKVDPRHLKLNTKASGQSTDGRLWRVYYDIVVDDVTVEGAYLGFVVNNGNLIQVLTQHLGNLQSLNARAGLDSMQAADVLATYVGGFENGDTVGKPRLSFAPFATEHGKPRLDYRLVWTLGFARPSAGQETWEAIVDANSGELLAFVDANDYAVVDGGVWPVAWRVNNVQQAQQVRPFPYVQTTQCGVTDLAGVFTFCGAANNEVRLNGRYVNIVDTCGAIVETDDATNDFHLGTLATASSPGDCQVPAGKSAGNTASAREQYYHVNLIKEKGRKYYPANAWLQGNLTANVNIASTCNAFWNGSSINFYRSGGGCGNTGEEIGVSLHEWGHGFDDNDGFPSADQATGEAMGDTMATTQSHDSCVGWGFRLTNGKCGGYGNPCTVCDGVRDIDYARHTNLSNNAPHAVRDNWNGVTGSGIRDGAGFECPNNASYRGPCGTEGHCESYPMSTANWDIANRDIPEQLEPSGPPYAAATLAQAWDIWDRLWWESRLDAQGGYQCPGSNENTADGCNAGSYWSIYRAVDDADGDLTNGTPHAGSIFNALYRHSIHCGTAAEARNQNNSDGCPTLSAPTLNVTPGSSAISLAWTDVTGATQYRVLRNELSCTAGFTEVAVVSDPTLTFVDADVANGVTYYYQIVPMAGSGECMGTPSNCGSGTPVLGPSVAYVAGSAVILSEGDSDGFADNCETVTARVTLLNDGNASISGVRLSAISSSDAAVAVTSTLPVAASPATLAPGATATATFTFTVGAGVTPATAFQALDFTVAATCNTCSLANTGSFAFTAEGDIATGTRTWAFTNGLEGWTATAGSNWTLTSSNPSPGSGGNAVQATPSQNTCDANPGAGNGACDALVSPIITLVGAGPWTVTLPFWASHETASTGAGAQHWDRANVHIINVGTGVHTLATPTGRAYTAGSNDAAGLCHIDSQLGWAHCSNFASWGNGTIDLAPFGAGAQLQIEINHNTDGVATSRGFYVDDISVTNVTTAVPDANSDSCGPCTPPAVPSLATATAGNASVTLTWVDVSGESGYRVYRSTVSGGPYTQVGSTAANIVTTVDGGLVNGTTYYYVVRAYAGTCESTNSNQLSATPNVVGGVTEVSANASPYYARIEKSGGSPTGYYAYWEKIGFGQGYHLYEGDMPATSVNHAAKTGNVCSVASTDLGNGWMRASFTPSTGNHYYLVTVYGGGTQGTSGYTSSGAERDPAQNTCSTCVAPATPVLASATPGNAQVTLAWNNVAGESGYRVYRATTTGGPYTLNGSTAADVTTYVDTTATNGTTYFYVVRSYNGTCQSANSNELSATPSACAGVNVLQNFEALPADWTVQSTATGGTWDWANPPASTNALCGANTQTAGNLLDGSGGVATTGSAAGTACGSFDVDGGYTRIISPVLSNLTAFANRRFSYDRHAWTDAANDSFRVYFSQDGGTNWTEIASEAVVNAQETPWQSRSVSLEGRGITVWNNLQIRWHSEDPGQATIVEGQIDNFRYQADCP